MMLNCSIETHRFHSMTPTVISSHEQHALDGGFKLAVQLLMDYRGKEVVAAWRYLPTNEMGNCCSRIDVDEAFASVYSKFISWV
jgi:hypothetical protein